MVLPFFGECLFCTVHQEFVKPVIYVIVKGQHTVDISHLGGDMTNAPHRWSQSHFSTFFFFGGGAVAQC